MRVGVAERLPGGDLLGSMPRYDPGMETTKRSPLAFAILLIFASVLHAQDDRELGRLWTFENPPLASLEAKYGFRPSAEWLRSLRLSSLRISGDDEDSGIGAGSFVSPNGLILTSTRCVRDAVAATRRTDIHLINSGFLALEQDQEFRLRVSHDKWLKAAQLIKVLDVSEQVNRGVAASDNDLQRIEKQEANKKAILDAARVTDPELLPEIVTLYQGAVVQLHLSKVYDDLRLVCTPHHQAASFGGDSENFTYPRSCLDFAFLRAYEDGKPVDTSESYLSWSVGGAQHGELVFVAGIPGPTKRLFTKAQLEFERDIKLPMRVEELTNALRIMKDPRSNSYAGEYDPENPSEYYAWMRTTILQLENDLKATRGRLQGLRDPKLMAQKGTAERAFQDRVRADQELAEEYGDLWNRIASVVEERRLHEARSQFYRAAGILDVAVDMVRSCDPSESEDQRQEAKRRLERWSGGTVNFNFHGTAFLLDHLDRARTWLPKEDPFLLKVLGGKSAQEFWDSVAPPHPPRSWLGFAKPRADLIESGWEAIQTSDEPVMVAARELVALIRLREKRDRELEAKEAALGAELGRARIACYGERVAPDGTSTLRFSDGVVRGIGEGGSVAPHRTTFSRLYERNAEFDDVHPFNLPKIWLDRKDTIDRTKPVNFVTTNDVSVGSAGSVVVNAALGVVGVVIDGNFASLRSDSLFSEGVSRAVSTHVDGILEALVKIYDAQHLVDEIIGKSSKGERGSDRR